MACDNETCPFNTLYIKSIVTKISNEHDGS